MARPHPDGHDAVTGPCRECGAPAVEGARFCGRCGAALAPPAPVRAEDEAQTSAGAPPRWVAGVGVAVAVAVLALVVWPSPRELDPGDRSGRDTVARLPEQLAVRWDVAGAGVGGPTRAGRPPVRLDADTFAVADVVVDASGRPLATRPPGALAAGRWAVAGSRGLVVGDAATGRVTAVLPWPAALTVAPVGPALAWVGGGSAVPADPVLAVVGGGAVRLDGEDLEVRWRADVVPVVEATDIGGDGGVLVPARVPGSATVDAVLDLRDGRVVARTTGDLRLLGVGHGLVLAADGDGVVTGWPLPEGPGTLELPAAGPPRWAVDLSPGRPVGVDVLDGGRFAVHAVDVVVGEARLVDARDGSVLAVVAGFPNADLDGGRTAEAFDDVVAGVVDDQLRRFSWDGTRLAAVPLGREGWFVARGDGLLQLVARRTGEVLLVTAEGDRVAAAVPPPRSGDGDRVEAVVGTSVGIRGAGGVRWVDVRTGELDIAPPPVVPSPEADGPALGIDGPAAAVAVAGPVGDDVVVVEAGAVALLAEGDGVERWRRALPARPALASRAPDEHPGVVVTSRHVVVPLADGTVVAVRRDDGTVAWTARVGVPSAIVGAGDEVLVATIDGVLTRLGADGVAVEVAALGDAVGELAVVGDVVLALLPERLVGIGPPGGPVPDEDRVDLSLMRPAPPAPPPTCPQVASCRPSPSTSPGG